MYCPNCGTQLPDDAEFCRNCGARVGARGDRGSGESLQGTAAEKKRKLSGGWITLISLASVLVLFCAIFLPIYYSAPLLPVASATSDGNARFTYDFDKKTGILKIEEKAKRTEDENYWYNRSPYADDQWLIALSDISSNYNVQSLQLCCSYGFSNDTLEEYVFGNNKYIANGKIKEIDNSYTDLDNSEYNRRERYVFEAKNNRLEKVTEFSDYDRDGSSYTYFYDDKGRITNIKNEEDEIGNIYQYDENGNFKSYTLNEGSPVSATNRGTHMYSYLDNLSGMTAVKADYSFKGRNPSIVTVRETSGDSGGWEDVTYTSSFKYKENHVSQISTKHNVKGETYFMDGDNVKKRDNSRKVNSLINFQYKRML